MLPRTPEQVWPWTIGGVEEDRTPDLRIANATLSQLSYHPIEYVICYLIIRKMIKILFHASMDSV